MQNNAVNRKPLLGVLMMGNRFGGSGYRCRYPTENLRLQAGADIKTFHLHIDENHLDKGMHEYMACFTADCALTIGDGPRIHITLGCDVPDYLQEPHHHDQTKSYLASAIEHIRQGMGYALLHRRHGLRVVITELRLHSVDYQPTFLMLHTYYYTRRQLEMFDDQDRMRHHDCG